MEKLEKNIKIAKDDFIVYCAKRFKNDAEITNKIEDIRYLELKNKANILSKRRKEDREMFNLSV